MKMFSVHKGYSSQSRTLGHLANPKDVEKAALDNPDLDFIIYHSALKHGPNEPEYQDGNKFDPHDRRFRLAQRADGHQEAQSEDQQRLSARSAASSTRW